MNVPQIQIQRTNALIGIRTTKPVQEIQQPPADLNIKQILASMQIERKPGHLLIDSEQARNELNLKSLRVLSRDLAEFSKQEGLAAVAEIAQEGDQLAAIENKTDVIVSIALEKASPPPADFNIAFIPSNGSIKINYQPTELQIDWKLGGAEIQSIQHKPIHQYTPGKTEIYLRQAQQLDINFIGQHLNLKT